MTRKPLPNRRLCEHYRFEHERVRYTAHVGRYDDGRLAEAFVRGGRAGDTIEAITRDMSLLLSLLLQYGCPVSVIRDSLTRLADGSPAGPAGVLLQMVEADNAVS